MKLAKSIIYSSFPLLILFSCGDRTPKSIREVKSDSIKNDSASIQTPQKVQHDLQEHKLFKHPVEFYIGRKIKDLLGDGNEQYSNYFYLEEPPGHLSGITFIYCDKRVVNVYVDKIVFNKPASRNSDWDLKLMLKETIDRIEFSPGPKEK